MGFSMIKCELLFCYPTGTDIPIFNPISTSLFGRTAARKGPISENKPSVVGYDSL